MSKALAKFILAAMLIVGIIVITILGMYHDTPGGMVAAEDGVLGMALMGLTNYETKEKQ